MRKTKYIFNGGRMSRKDNTLIFQPEPNNGVKVKPTYLPIEDVGNLYCFGALDANSALYNFLGKQRVSLHFFDYYEHYTGSFMPKDYLWAGKLQVLQTQHYLELDKRMILAKSFVRGGSEAMVEVLKYYLRKDRNVRQAMVRIGELQFQINDCEDVQMLMGIEGNVRKAYYSAFDAVILGDDFVMNGRSMRPPKNAVNALISFGNMMCYTLCLDSIYHTQLNPTISFLHEPGAMRYSLALDIAEIFKPILVDRTIFSLINRKQLRLEHFDTHLNGIWLSDSGRKVFIKAYEERLKETFKHPRMKKNVSYRTAVKYECHKLSRYLLTGEEYLPFSMVKQA
ncbi:MAG: CRISPR-associated protein Cas1 [Saprospiraceae bacterium]|jgi:CRISPR-associated protein Cas1